MPTPSKHFKTNIQNINHVKALHDKKAKLFYEYQQRLVYDEFMKLPADTTRCQLVNLIHSYNFMSVFRHIATTRKIPKSNCKVTLTQQKFLIEMFGVDGVEPKKEYVDFSRDHRGMRY